MANSPTTLAGRAPLNSGVQAAEENTAPRDGQVREAVTVLQPIRDRARGEQRRCPGLYLTVKLAVTIAVEREYPEASDESQRSLSPIASGRIRQTSDAGPEADALLSDFHEFVRRNSTSRELMTYASELLAQWNEMQGLDRQQSKTSADVLSPRQLAIVELMAQGQSNKEMARQLGLAPDTVKEYVENVFRKLGVEARAQAVARAHALGLIGGGAQISVREAGSDVDPVR